MTEEKTIDQISEMMLTWHHHFERVAIVAARLGLSIDDGVIFTRMHQRSPAGVVIPVGWRFIASNGKRDVTAPAIANTADASEALNLITAMIDQPTKPRPVLR